MAQFNAMIPFTPKQRLNEDTENDGMKEYRVRISNYGKWYLPPETFNRNFDMMKSSQSPEQIEKQVVERI
jgi:hypothetical protein